MYDLERSTDRWSRSVGMIGLLVWIVGWPVLAPLALTLLVHELGHLLVADWFGIPATRMRIGAAPMLRWRCGTTEVVWGILPIFGLVECGVSPSGGTLYRLSRWRRALVEGAGPAANLLTALVLLGTLAAGWPHATGLGRAAAPPPLFDLLVAGWFAAPTLTSIIHLLLWWNAIVGAVSLAPVPLLDGGQIVEALTEGCSPSCLSVLRPVQYGTAAVMIAVLFAFLG